MFGSLLLSERNLILTGYTGPNPPRVGQTIASRLQMPFIDLDRQIEMRAGDPPQVLRTRYGEQHLKTVVNEIMQEVILHRQHVIRIDGSTLLTGDYFQRLQTTGPVICLVARLDAILRRLHLSLGARFHDPNQRALALSDLRREWRVRELKGIHELDVTYLNEEQTITGVIQIWREASIERA